MARASRGVSPQAPRNSLSQKAAADAAKAGGWVDTPGDIREEAATTRVGHSARVAGEGRMMGVGVAGAVGAAVDVMAASLDSVLGDEAEEEEAARAEAAASCLKACPGGGRRRSWRREKKGREAEIWLDGAVITPVIES